MHRYDRGRQALAVAAAGLAGYVDAHGFMAGGGYFVSFMSGNTTRLGVDLVWAPPRAWAALGLLVLFVAGVAAGALVAARAGPRHKPAVLGMVAAVLTAAALVHAALGTAAIAVIMALLVAAMGALNNTFQRDGEVTVGLTYMTGALVRLGQAIAARCAGRDGSAWAGWALLWSGLAGGALAGAWAWTTIPALSLWAAAGLAALLAVAARRLA